jgi:hypothetical protein
VDCPARTPVYAPEIKKKSAVARTSHTVFTKLAL